MLRQNKTIYIQSMSACCAAGLDKESIFEATLKGHTGIKVYQDILIDGNACAIGKIDSEKSFDTLLVETVEDLLVESTLDNFEDTFLLIGTSVGGMAWAENKFIEDKGSYQNIVLEKQSIHSIAHTLNKKFSFKDTITFSTACTSSSNAVVFAKEILEAGACKQVLVLGVDSLSQTTVNGFHALGVLSDKGATPFDKNRVGMNVSEGIGAVLFSTEKNTVALAGVGCSSDAYNITHPEPAGTGAKRAMQKALDNAGIDASAIAYINTHGTGTMANDTSEGRAIEGLFPHKPYVGSTKSITGHTLGACGVIELIITAMSMERNIIPSNFNLQEAEIETLNLPTENISGEFDFALSNAFAFGGNNVSLVLKKVFK